jgi:hypothetical protein
MLQWWQAAGIDRADMAIRRSEGTMLWHHDRQLPDLPLRWVRAENAQGAEVYARPARGRAWAMVFLDDVRTELAIRIARKYSALVVETSPAGGCHVWLTCSRPLAETERKLAQVYLAGRVGADPGSVSGEHLGRLAGFKNWKRGGAWIDVVAASRASPWTPLLSRVRSVPVAGSPRHARADADQSESAREWGWVCGVLEAGVKAEVVYRRLVAKARPRRGGDAERYAHRTIAQALRRIPAAVEPGRRSAIPGESYPSRGGDRGGMPVRGDRTESPTNDTAGAGAGRGAPGRSALGAGPPAAMPCWTTSWSEHGLRGIAQLEQEVQE